MSQIVKRTVAPFLGLLLLAAGALTLREALQPKKARAATTYYAAPGSGSGCSSTVGWASGTGATNCRWTLGVALNGGAGGNTVAAGDTIKLTGGTYTGNFVSNLVGTAGAPIIIQPEATTGGCPFTGNCPILSGGTTNVRVLQICSQYTQYWNLEVTTAATDRTSPDAGPFPGGIDIGQGIESCATGSDGQYKGNKVINSIVHDTRQGISSFVTETDSEYYGNHTYFNGWNGSDNGHGHGIYSQNSQAVGGYKYFKHHVSHDNFGENGQIYDGSSGKLANYTVDQYFSYSPSSYDFRASPSGKPGKQRGLTIGGTSDLFNPTVSNSVFFCGDCSSQSGDIYFGYNSLCTGTRTITGNTFRSTGSPWLFGAGAGCATPNTMTGNDFQINPTGGGFNSGSYPTNTYRGGTAPVVEESIVLANAYQAGRGLVWINNGDGVGTTKSVNVSSILTSGVEYEVLNTQNPKGDPVLCSTTRGTCTGAGVYGGGSLTFPTTSLTAATALTMGYAPQAIGAAGYNLFQVITLSGGAATPTPTSTQTFTSTNTPTNTFTATNTFTPSNTPTLTPTLVGATSTPTPTQTPLPGGCTYAQAEAGTLVAPMVSSSDVNAFGGLYVSSVTGNSGTATFSFAPGAGTYYLAQRILSTNGTNDSMFVSRDGEADTTHIDDTAEQSWSPDWQTTRVTDRSIAGCSTPLAGNPAACQMTFVIADGLTHTIAFRTRDANTKLDWVALCPSSAIPIDPPLPLEPTATNTPLPTNTPGGPTSTNTPTATQTATRTPTPTPDPIIGPYHWHAPCNGSGVPYRHRHPPRTLRPHRHC